MLETVLEPAIKAPSAPMVELINGKALPKVPANNSALATGILATSDKFTPELIKILTIGIVKTSTKPAPKTVLVDSLKALFSALPGFLVCRAAATKALITNKPPGKYRGLKLALTSASPKAVVKSNVALVNKDSNPANTLEHTSKTATSK